MFKKTPPDAIDDLIKEILDTMSTLEPDSDEYRRMGDELERFYKIKGASRPDRVSRDTFAIIAGNLVGILIIVAYERVNVIRSKAIGQIIKTK